jgi:hypothetical protein
VNVVHASLSDETPIVIETKEIATDEITIVIEIKEIATDETVIVIEIKEIAIDLATDQMATAKEIATAEMSATGNTTKMIVTASMIRIGAAIGTKTMADAIAIDEITIVDERFATQATMTAIAAIVETDAMLTVTVTTEIGVTTIAIPVVEGEIAN